MCYAEIWACSGYKDKDNECILSKLQNGYRKVVKIWFDFNSEA